MPSGAKKRKASKKKKENQPLNQPDSAPASVNGEDERDSDVREASSPVSHDHQKQSEGTDASSMGVEASATRLEKEIKIEDELDTKDAAHGGGSSGSSGGSSSSDDESHEIKKVEAESSIALVEPDVSVAEGGDSVVGSNTEKITVSSERVELDAIPSADISVVPPVIEPAFNENGKKKCCSVKESIQSTPDQKAFVVTQENDDRSTSTYVASTAAVDNGSHHIKDSEATQRVATPSPYPIQKTSWKSCCGLFEVFSASGA